MSAVTATAPVLSGTGRDLDILCGNILRLEGMAPVLAALDSEGIHVAGLKGFALLHTVYREELQCRDMADIDLMVVPEQLSAAERVLLAHGFSRTAGGEYGFVRGAGQARIKIDLHDGLPFLDPSEQARFLARAARVQPDTTPLRVPTVEDHMITIAVHAVIGHGQLRPQWLEDLHRLSEGEVDWAQLVRRALRWQTALPVGVALAACRARGSTAIPDHIIRALQGRRRQLPARFLQRVLARPEIPDMGHLLGFLFRFGARDRGRALLRQFAPGDEFLERRYGLAGRWSVLSARVLRPMRTLARSVRLLFRIARTTPQAHAPGGGS